MTSSPSDLDVVESRGPQNGLKRTRFVHDGIIDRIIAKPFITQTELAREFNYTQGRMSIIVNSDTFKFRLKERKAQIVDPLITASTEEMLTAVTKRSLEVLADELYRPNPDPEIAMKCAALGLKSQPQATPLVNIDLRGLASNMLNMVSPPSPGHVGIPSVV